MSKLLLNVNVCDKVHCFKALWKRNIVLKIFCQNMHHLQNGRLKRKKFKHLWKPYKNVNIALTENVYCIVSNFKGIPTNICLYLKY